MISSKSTLASLLMQQNNFDIPEAQAGSGW